MANIVIKELLSSDKVNEIIDKINFNFDQLLLNGGGPPGIKGGPGTIGPIGPRGTIWFTVADLWTTINSPNWTGTTAKANDINLPGYPQYKGDPNRFQPVAPATAVPSLPWIFPENTFTFSIPIKPVRGGDLYLQESDDTFNSQQSSDGDIWEFNAISATWSRTGVNIKGNVGEDGSNSNSEWIRESLGIDDLIYPKNISGQDIPRVLLGQYTDVYKKDNSTSILTINTDVTHIALNNPSIHNELINPGDEEFGVLISVNSGGDFLLQGSTVGTSKQIILQSDDSNITIQSGGSFFTTYQQDPSNSKHIFEGGSIEVYHPDSSIYKYSKYIAPSGTLTYHTLTQTFDTDKFRVNINTDASGYGSTALNLASTPHILFQNGINKNVGIGTFELSTLPLSKLGIKGNLSVGLTYGNLLSPDPSGAIIEGRVAIGASTFPAQSDHKLQVNGSIVLGKDNSLFGDNVFFNTSLSVYFPLYSLPGPVKPAWYIKQESATSQFHIRVFPPSAGNSSLGNQSNPNSSYFTIRQSQGQNLGKVGINMQVSNLDSRLTINDTDGTGIHFIRESNYVVGTNFTSSTSGARIWHDSANNVSQPLKDGRFNIYQLQAKDFVIGNNTDSYPTGIHHRIVIKKESGFIGINTKVAAAPLTIKGRDNSAEDIDTDYSRDDVDPDEINIGTFEDVSITGLNVDTTPSGGGTHNTTDIQGGSYIGFNAWFEKTGDNSTAQVVYGKTPQPSGFGFTEGQSGAMIFTDRNGNIHFANFEYAP